MDYVCKMKHRNQHLLVLRLDFSAHICMEAALNNGKAYFVVFLFRLNPVKLVLG